MKNIHSYINGKKMSLESETLSDAQIQEKAKHLLSEMTLEEKIDQMTGDTPLISGAISMSAAYNIRPYPSGENNRLGIPAIEFTDGPRGVVVGHSTCFPVSMGRWATWDTELEERVGDAMGVEARSQGANFFAGVCINLLRHPAWRRAQETYGEDPFHLGEMGAALVRGVQRHVMACIKHFAANSIENSRFKVDVRMNERTLREVYLPHFKRCIDEGAAAVMSAYNKVNGRYCGHNGHLLRDILKNDYKFKGFVISDFLLGIRQARAAVEAGLDIEMPFAWRFGKLRKLIKNKVICESVIDESVCRILAQKLKFAGIGEPHRYGLESICCKKHRELALETARKSIVLLKNAASKKTGKPLLPIDASQNISIAVIGRLAAAKNLGDKGSSRVRPPYTVSILEGLHAAAGGSIRIFHDSGKDINKAVTTARQADLVVLVAGYTHRDEGEYIPIPPKGGDRGCLTLSQKDETLIQAIAFENPNTVTVLIGGSAIITESWRQSVPAMLMAWYPGMEGGHAVADALFGNINPSGRLPCVFPRSIRHLPYFDKKATSIEYDMYHGYRLMDKKGFQPAFCFGYGLSYTSFAYSGLKLDHDVSDPNGTLTASVDITNTGDRPGEETAQIYVGYDNSGVERPVRELKGFKRIHLEPKETRRIEFILPVKQLAYFEEKKREWLVEPAEYRLYAGSSSRPSDLIETAFRILP